MDGGFRSFRMLWWGQASYVYDETGKEKVGEPDSKDEKTLTGDVYYTKYTGADAKKEVNVTIVAELDSAPSFNAEQNETRLQRVLEVATNNLLSEKIITPAEDPKAIFEKIREFWGLDTNIEANQQKIDTALAVYGKAVDGDYEKKKRELMDILTAQNLGDVGAYGDSAADRFVTKAGPLTGVRIGALGKVTAISSAELARTTADDYGLSVDAIDGPTSQFEYDLGIGDMLGARFSRKLEAMVNAVTCCILSSKWGYNVGRRRGKEELPSLMEDEDGKKRIYDPTVLALWAGKVNPEDTKTEGGQMFQITPNAAKYGQALLTTGVPSLPTADLSYTFVEQVFEDLKKKSRGGFFPERVALRRVDGDIEPSMLTYVPEEICFGPGMGNRRGKDEKPVEYFGTGWSTTMTAELVQVAGNFVEGEIFSNWNTSQERRKSETIKPETVSNFLRDSYMGYVHLRAAELRRPVFAFLCNKAVIERLGDAAGRAGAVNGEHSSDPSQPPPDAYGKFFRAVNRLSFTPEGEPLRRLVEPYLVRVGTVNPYTVSTLMHLGQWFLPSPLMKSIDTRCCAELVDAARTRPSKYHAGSRGTRQPSDNTLASAIRERVGAERLTLKDIFRMTAATAHDALEGHLCNFLVAMNRLEDISHEKGARRGLGLGQGYGTQIRVTDQRARIVADAIVSLPKAGV